MRSVQVLCPFQNLFSIASEMYFLVNLSHLGPNPHVEGGIILEDDKGEVKRLLAEEGRMVADKTAIETVASIIEVSTCFLS